MTVNGTILANAQMNELGSTVKLNVGGKQFEVSYSLINEYPESMLGRLVSDTWHKADAESTVFIDRDGDIFGHILNYIRYGSIELPSNLPMSMFQRELDYYQFGSNGGIKQVSSIDTMKELRKNVEEAELHHDMFVIAVDCYHQYMMEKKEVSIAADDSRLKHTPFHYNLRSAMKVLNYYLSRYYGLTASPSRDSLFIDDFILDVREERDAEDNAKYTLHKNTSQCGLLALISP